MVYFECQKCNETVKKPKLAKHLMSCRSHTVSCIDCNKVFGWDEWEKHTSCVSEAQKYQGNLYQAKENQNKGQKKQENWLQNVQTRIADPGSKIAPHVKSQLEKLLGFDNIPRKQKPFTNFVKNSLKIWNEKAIAEIWDVINAANAAPKQPPAPAATKATPETPAQAKWAGWKRALDDELEKADGREMTWKRLRDAVVARHRREVEVNGTNEEELQSQALAHIPENYLSKKDDFVRLPKST